MLSWRDTNTLNFRHRMPLPENLLTMLTCPRSRALMEEQIHSRPKLRCAAVMAWTSEMSPADLYCYLWARFGSPNGLQNFLRANDSDNLIHWEWVLDHPVGRIHLQGMNFRTEILVLGELSIGEHDCNAFADLFKRDFVNHGRAMAELRKKLEHWFEFVNPYQRIRTAVAKLLLDLRALDLQPESQKIADIRSAKDYKPGQWDEISGRYSRGLGLCFGIRSMLPVMAEAYVNFLMFALLRPELKADIRLRENALRQPIDIRVKTLHITCVGFERPVDYATPACKAYHTLVNERNDLLHGNVVLEKLRFNDVYFNGRVPVFKTYRSMWDRTIGVQIDAVGLHRLEEEVATVKTLVTYLSSCLKPEIRNEIAMMAKKRDLGWNEKDARMGTLFADHLVDAHLVFKDQAPKEKSDG